MVKNGKLVIPDPFWYDLTALLTMDREGNEWQGVLGEMLRGLMLKHEELLADVKALRIRVAHLESQNAPDMKK